MTRALSPEMGELISLLYPVTTARALAEVLGPCEKTIWGYASRLRISKEIERIGRPIGHVRSHKGYDLQKVALEGPRHVRFAFAHVLAWEKYHRMKKPDGHVVVFLDGDRQNYAPENLHCLPKSELLKWMRFVQCPLDVHIDKLWRKVMALDTSEKVKQKLLQVLENVSDPDKTPDLVRQRAVCETVNTLIGLLRVEVSYLAAIEGDGVIPFLEGARSEMVNRRSAARKRRGLLASPPADHPWRGLGQRPE